MKPDMKFFLKSLLRWTEAVAVGELCAFVANQVFFDRMPDGRTSVLSAMVLWVVGACIFIPLEYAHAGKNVE